jgi:3',5'-cyclic AMP phosphodiesterase CpdA
MRALLFALSFAIIAHAATGQEKKIENAFLVSPYLQIGKNPSATSLQLLWHSTDVEKDWLVEYQVGSSWKKAELKFKGVAVTGVDPHRVYNASFTGLEPGKTFNYKVSVAKKVVFTSDAHALKEKNQPYRFVAFGDIGAGTPEQKPLANRAFLSKPDLVIVPGDIVYEHGLVSEYRTKFWPIYNADKIDEQGAPLLRSVAFVAAPGNHDTDTRNLDIYPDALAYFQFWDQPLNGPVGQEGGAFVPTLIASEANRKSFMEAAGETYPVMTNFSYNYGNAHWTFLDSNPYMDWTDKTLIDWVTNDLASAKDATWKFVVFHHPGFNSAREHYEQQHMRLLSPIFDANKVDVVFNGHVHNYQRSYPMRFTPDKKGTLLVGGKENKIIRGRVVNGRWTLDKTFDGEKDTTPEGVIYIITGAGGQELYNPEQNDDQDSWQKFTYRFVSNVHSLTVADVDGKTLTLSQVAADGKELDRIKITK